MFKHKEYLAASVAFFIAAMICSTPALAQNKQKKSVAKIDSAINRDIQEIPEINVGYLKFKASNVTGAFSVIEGTKINEQSKISADVLLQGQAAGVQVVASSGAAGAGALINIRGISSLNAGTAPLVIIDGIPGKASRIVSPLGRNADNNFLADINPLDIAKITVLKDAQATAIYGMRGANGVILIDTYGGTSGKTVLDFSGFTGVMASPNEISVFNADEYRSYILEKEKSRGLTDAAIKNGVGKYLLLSTPSNQIERYNNNTDWQNLINRSGVYNDYHFMLRGGDAVATYSLNVGYTGQSGSVENTNFNRFSTRFNLDYKVGRKLSFLNSLSYSQTTKKQNDGWNALTTNPLYLSALKSPTLAAFTQDASGIDERELDSVDYAGRSNPYSIVNRMINKGLTNRISGRIIGQYVFSPNLNLRVGVYADFSRLNEKRFRPSAGFAPDENIIRESSAQSSIELMALNENTLNYNRKSKSGNHEISAVIGSAIQSTSIDSKWGVYVNAPSDQLSSIDIKDQRYIDTLTSFSPVWNLLSFFGSSQYAFKGKYLIGASLRTDGSSRFEKGNRWGVFPSISAGWIISSEPFLQNSKIISNLKLRGSYGITGNQEVGYYNSFNAAIPASYFNYPAVRLGLLGNKNFTWEETKQANAGLDLGIFKDRLSLSADAYIKNTSNLYNRILLPGISGFSSYPVSEGAVRNSGIELGVSARLLTGKIKWNSALNGAYNKNEITSLPALLETVNSYGDFSGIAQIGSSVGAFYGYNALGVYRSTADVNVKNGANDSNPFKGGDIIFEDVVQDGVIDENDRKVLGKSTPDFFGGFSNTFTYKNLDLNIFMDFSVGNEVYNAQKASLEAMSTYDNQSVTINSRWKTEGDVTNMPRLLHGDAVGNARFSSRWIEDGSYIRFKSITFGYNLPADKILKGTFKSARLTLSGQNLLTITDYSGQSPEVANVTNPTMYSQSYGHVPQLRSFILGVKLGL